MLYANSVELIGTIDQKLQQLQTNYNNVSTPTAKTNIQAQIQRLEEQKQRVCGVAEKVQEHTWVGNATQATSGNDPMTYGDGESESQDKTCFMQTQ